MASRAGTWFKMLTVGAVLCIGGPALVYYVSPTEEELFKRYNPDLQRRSLENRKKNQEEFDHFVLNLKELSKSDKPIWAAQADADRTRAAERRAQILAENDAIAAEMRRQQQEVRNAR
ncbi:CBP4-domain-containing protein [Rhizodiscina lignyota]|uniref:Cytochrome b mRNA-processing protein 4 n=1 Tax=Rhizodiscina lignyota TaxID=1504668 RepID=A0A9P4M5R4_9PEZI|nr:CBP4-domain-containing protein [Rhizodiscina lignyota]